MLLPEVKIKNILYATDLSENARYAFAYAVSLADMYKAKITILHVMPDEEDIVEANLAAYMGKERWEAIRASHYSEAQESLIGKKRDHILIRELLGKFCENAKAGNDNSQEDEIVIDRGNPVTQIIKQCNAKECDMIVMGSRGHSTLADVIMGSITKRVLRRTDKPVLVVRLPKE